MIKSEIDVSSSSVTESILFSLNCIIFIFFTANVFIYLDFKEKREKENIGTLAIPFKYFYKSILRLLCAIYATISGKAL